MINEQEYKTNALGHKVPVELIKPIDLIRDELVNDLTTKINEQRKAIVALKIDMMKAVNDFIDLSASEYGIEFGGTKGNVTLTSFNGQYKVVRAIGEPKHFNEHIQVAKTLLDECIESWSPGANKNYKALVDHAFRVNKQGKIDFNQVMSLLKLDIDDDKWRLAMSAIIDSIEVVGSSEYLRFYRKDSSGKYQQIYLDFSRV